MAINQDDALGVGEEYSDTQGMLGSGRGKARPTATVEVAEGGGKAKWFLIAFALMMLAVLGWVGWRFLGSGGAEVDAGALLLPAAESNALPMTGAPVNEAPVAPAVSAQPLGPVEEMLPPAAAPVEPTVAVFPAGAASPTEPGAPAATASATQLATAPAESPLPGPMPTTSMAAAEQAAKEASTIASLREELSSAKARIAALEKEASNRAPAPARTAKPAATARRSGSAPRSVAASAAVREDRKPTAKAPSPPGVILKAVLEGRAWLQIGSGDTISVATGDDVAGVGTVSAIDAERAEVRFASGAVLK